MFFFKKALQQLLYIQQFFVRQSGLEGQEKFGPIKFSPTEEFL